MSYWLQGHMITRTQSRQARVRCPMSIDCNDATNGAVRAVLDCPIWRIRSGSCAASARYRHTSDASPAWPSIRARWLPGMRRMEGHAGLASDVCRRSEEHTSELQSHLNLVCRLLL